MALSAEEDSQSLDCGSFLFDGRLLLSVVVNTYIPIYNEIIKDMEEIKMKKQFTKLDLQTGDIVVLRDKQLGVVILEKDIILYQAGGYEELCMFTDDLLSELESDDDIMCVYRGYDNSPTGFGLHIDEDLVYCRDYSYVETHTHNQPSHNPNNNNLINVVMQAMYGNRTGMSLKEEDIDRYILGHLSSDYTITEDIDRSIIHIPNSKCVIVYNKYQEESRLERMEYLLQNDNYELKPLATIPELNISLYSRCLMCRMDDYGHLASLEDGDGEIVVKYLNE